jgi:methionyl-tRNA synthetase
VEDKKEKIEEKIEEAEEVSIDDFAKLDFRVAKILSCEDHPNADKLYVLKIKIGDEERQIVSGIKKWYKPQDLIDKKVVVIYNLKPVKLRGVKSQGMVLAAEKGKKLSLVSTLEDIPDGAKIS